MESCDILRAAINDKAVKAVAAERFVPAREQGAHAESCPGARPGG